MLKKELIGNPTITSKQPLADKCPTCEFDLIFYKQNSDVSIAKNKSITRDELYHYCANCKESQFCGPIDITDAINKTIIKMMFSALNNCFVCNEPFEGSFQHGEAHWNEMNESPNTELDKGRSAYRKKCYRCGLIFYKLDGKLSFNLPIRSNIKDTIDGTFSITDQKWNIHSTLLNVSKTIDNLSQFNACIQKINDLYILI